MPEAQERSDSLEPQEQPDEIDLALVKRQGESPVYEKPLDRETSPKDIRRAKVALYQSMGLTQAEIAKRLGVSPRTVAYDIKYLQEVWASQIENIDLNLFVGELVAAGRMRKRRANLLYTETTMDAVKLGALKIMAEEDERVVRLLQSVGKLHREPEEVRLTTRRISALDELFEREGTNGIVRVIETVGRDIEG